MPLRRITRRCPARGISVSQSTDLYRRDGCLVGVDLPQHSLCCLFPVVPMMQHRPSPCLLMRSGSSPAGAAATLPSLITVVKFPADSRIRHCPSPYSGALLAQPSTQHLVASAIRMPPLFPSETGCRGNRNIQRCKAPSCMLGPGCPRFGHYRLRTSIWTGRAIELTSGS